MKPYERVLSNPTVAEILKTWPGGTITMKEPNRFEIEAMYEGAAVGGEYLDTIGKTDLATLTESEYLGFIEKVIRAYEEKCLLLYTDGDPNGMPFGPID